MQKVSNAILIIVLVAVLATPAMGSKVLVVPTADVLAQGNLELDYVYHRGVNSALVQFGIYPGLSVGVKQNLGGQFYGTLKAAIFEETSELPGFAIGGEVSLDHQNLYAAVSKQLGTPFLRGHLALGSGRYSRGMAGVSFMLNPVRINNAPTTSLFMEYDGKGLGGGLIAQFSPELKANVGLAVGHGLSFGLNYKMAF